MSEEIKKSQNVKEPTSAGHHPEVVDTKKVVKEIEARGQRFSGVRRVEAVLGNIVVRTDPTHQAGDKQAPLRDHIIPLERAEAVMNNWKNIMAALMRAGDPAWKELGEIVSDLEARIKEAKEYRHKNNINPTERAI